jgi:hypothetical protein
MIGRLPLTLLPSVGIQLSRAEAAARSNLAQGVGDQRRDGAQVLYLGPRALTKGAASRLRPAGIATGVPRIAADLLDRPSRQRRATAAADTRDRQGSCR